MLIKMPTHYNDDTLSSCVIAGDFIFLAHHGGGQDCLCQIDGIAYKPQVHV